MLFLKPENCYFNRVLYNPSIVLSSEEVTVSQLANTHNLCNFELFFNSSSQHPWF
jgi:hypothetical protein